MRHRACGVLTPWLVKTEFAQIVGNLVSNLSYNAKLRMSMTFSNDISSFQIPQTLMAQRKSKSFSVQPSKDLPVLAAMQLVMERGQHPMERAAIKFLLGQVDICIIPLRKIKYKNDDAKTFQRQLCSRVFFLCVCVCAGLRFRRA